MKPRLILLLLLLTPQTLAAQPTDIPIDIPFCLPTADAAGYHSCGSPGIAALANGRFVVVASVFSSQEYRIVAEIVGPQGRIGGRDLASVPQDSGTRLDWPAVAATGAGGFVAAWNTFQPPASALYLQWYDANARPRLLAPVAVAASGEPYCNWFASLAANASGDTVIAWQKSEACTGISPPFGVELQAFNALGRPATARLHVTPVDPLNGLGSPRVGIDSAGRFTAVWVEKLTTVEQFLRGQRFRRNGQPLGEPFEIHGTGWVHAHRVLPDGRVAVVWDSGNPRGFFELGLYEPDGTPVAPRLDLGAGPGGAIGGIAADRHGNLAIFGISNDARWLRLVSQDLVPQGYAGPLVFPALLAFNRGMGVALSDQGLVFVVGSARENDELAYLVGHFLRARHEDDTCVRTRDGLFLCETTGGGREASLRVQMSPGPPWGTPFLADWNGDGRDDLCVYRERIFACDLDRNGSFDVQSPRMGKPGDAPVLADLDGDGRADPCLRRGVALLCDRARDGAAADLQILFGRPGERLILGDPDGDGRDDPCVVRDGVWLCDTRHDGGTADFQIDLRPLHMDGTPLFGDVNGDGRDEACLFQATRFLCSFFPPQGGPLHTTWELSFGQRGAVPLLGNVDAF